MTGSRHVPFIHPGAREWTAPEPISSARTFHRTLDGYHVSPLTALQPLATELGVGHILLKDESQRLGLPAFKILGASWAIANALARRFGMGVDAVTLDALRTAIGDTPLTLVTATDGNHGRAVSRMARLIGVRARVYTPAGVSLSALNGIRSEGAELVELDGSYDDAVRVAAASTVGVDSEMLIQDTSWSGYEDVPRWIVEGYTTLFSELDEQLAGLGLAPDVVVVPTGVGSLLQAAVEYYRGMSRHRPAVVSVESAAAACVLTSLRAGDLRSVDTSDGTIMTGLCAGTTSEIAWPSLRDGLDASIAVDDEPVRAAVQVFGALGLDVGPCGAASLVGLRTVLGDETMRKALEIADNAVVVLLSTEGLAANPLA